MVWRIAIGLAGGLVSTIGGIMLVVPGPGLLLILAGLGILATEFAWAGEVLLQAKKMANKLRRKVD